MRAAAHVTRMARGGGGRSRLLRLSPEVPRGKKRNADGLLRESGAAGGQAAAKQPTPAAPQVVIPPRDRADEAAVYKTMEGCRQRAPLLLPCRSG